MNPYMFRLEFGCDSRLRQDADLDHSYSVNRRHRKAPAVNWEDMDSEGVV